MTPNFPMPPKPHLLCIDLQTGEGAFVAPDARAIFSARQLLSIARRERWAIAHTRLRRDRSTGGGEDCQRQAAGVRPLISERVFLHSRRSGADCAALAEQLEQWSQGTVYVAAFDSLALLAMLIDRIERGPRFVVVEDAIAPGLSGSGGAARDAIAASVNALATRITLSALVAALGAPAVYAAGPA